MDSQQLAQRIDELVRKIETMADADARSSCVELLQSLMELHGSCLERMLELVAEAGAPGRAVIEGFARDELVKGLLLLYGLHPVALETRVMQALDKVRPYLSSHGGNVEVIGIEDGVVRLRLQGSCKSCPSSAMTLKLAIEEAIYEAAPDVTAIEAEGVFEPPPPAVSGLVSLERTRRSDDAAAQAVVNGHGWEQVNGLSSLAQGAAQAVEVGGRTILFCHLDETFYAYSSNCPGCGRALPAAALEGATLVCPACEQRYDCKRAGRGLDEPGLYLEPFPLLIEQGRMKVAVPHPATS
ncbi:MAG: hypothetical protein QOF02_398 [Blastocatellia bacterium]|jgi:Fe-S cluster biogenesis protein NfuA/nitrite reductase/ring-hydroxylating ferredoxin subunit|nr:hypothetical protein [Blastocatellia bacterium]